MKSLFVTLALIVCSASAFATADLSKGEKLNIVRKNGVETSYKGLVKLNTYRFSSCGFAQRCIGNNRELEVIIKDGEKIVNDFKAPLLKTEDHCGSVVYSASVDDRPVDGSLVQIEVMDNSERLCRDFRPGLIEVRIKTAYVSRMDGKEIVSNYELLATIQPADLAKGVELSSVVLNSKEEQNGSNGFVQVIKSKKQVLVSYNYTSCPQDSDGNSLPVACPAVLYKKNLQLKLDSVTRDACGSVIYHAVPAEILMGGAYHDVTVTDNRKNTCETFAALPAIEVKGRTSYPYPGRSTTEFTMTK